MSRFLINKVDNPRRTQYSPGVFNEAVVSKVVL